MALRQRALRDVSALLASEVRWMSYTRPRPRPAKMAAGVAAGAPPGPARDAVVPQQQQQPEAQLARADEWTAVVHEQTGLTYYWNQRTNETTALGERRPGPEGRLAQYRQQQQLRPVVSLGSLTYLLAAGAGVGFVFALLSRVF